MPRIAIVDGLVVKLYFNDHPPPHIHIYVGRVRHPGVHSARLSIETGEIIAGKLPPARVATAKGWCQEHRDALLVDWRRARLGLHPTGRYHSS
jgi:hypothetical protein